MKIARFRPTDLEGVLRLHAQTFNPMDLTSFLWQPCQQIESLEKDCAKRVCKEEEIKGYGAAYRLDETHFRLNLIVDPQHTKQGLGTLLLNEIEAEVRRSGGKYLQARLLENMEASLAFALARGFIEIHRMRGMSLHANDFSYEKWEGLGAALSASGFLATTFKDEAKANNDPIAKLAELLSRAREGWLSPDPTWRGNMSTDNLQSFFTTISVPERFSIMKFNHEYVGYTSAERENMTGTAVHPRFRGRGIATYLKAYDIKKCIDAGQKYFESCSANPAMFKVNERLGYQFNGLTEVRLVKYL